MLASRLTPPHLFHFTFFALAITSLSPTLPFSPSRFLSFSLLKTFSISTHTVSIKLAYQISFGFVFWNQKEQEQEQEQPTSLPGYCTAHVQHSSLLLSSCYCTDKLHLSLCLPVYYLPSTCYRCSFSHKQWLICTQRCTILFFWWWGWKMRILDITSSDPFLPPFSSKKNTSSKTSLISRAVFCGKKNQCWYTETLSSGFGGTAMASAKHSTQLP